ncbi:CotH kinase family protein [Aeromicrobium wangtongii]|uniref:CotH kinase family protein n=1 Tax=Aeromicrobium wangtongii TaxID=2969247 RepID=UPI0020181575|nr:CotH kinase family protein [Aeromicrobium wangtongii]MCL3818033.1 CotH kinase family protein [Aeromicrobium wangtongii]
MTSFLVTGLVAPTPASAAVAPLTVKPSRPVQNKTFTIQGTVTPKFARPVRLQRYLGGRWTTVRNTKSTSSGRYSFTYKSGAASLTLRTYVPKAKRKGKGHAYSSQKSAKLVVKPVRPAPAAPKPVVNPAPVVEPAPATTSLTVANGPGHTVRADVTSTPATAGRTVEVQHLVGGTWVTDATGTQPASGRTSVSFDAPDPGTLRYRAVVTGQGLPASTSPESQLIVQSPVARVDIRTDDGTPITSGEAYVPGEIIIDPRGSDLAPSTTRTRLRVRGNSTAWVKIKLSYKIKLDEKTPLLGLPASKDWALLANFYDRSLIRNELAFEASRRVGLPWTPRMRFAELWVDGSYRGLYQVGQSIEAEPGRVDVPDGGYLLEGDSHVEDDPAFRTSRGFQIFFKEPDDLDAPAQADVARTVQAAEDAIYAGDLSRIDVRSFVDWYIVNELLKNHDSAVNNSDWMVLSPEGTLSMGPVWDFDQAMGNRSGFGADLPSGLFTGGLFGVVAPSQILLPEGHWYNQLLSNPAFMAELKARWREVRTPLAGLSDHAAKLTREVRDSAPRNFAEGNGGLGLPIGPSILDDQPTHVFHGSWPAEAAALQSWIADRYAWMDGYLSD